MKADYYTAWFFYQNRTAYEHMHVPGIEHIYATDLQDKDHVHKMYNQLNVHSIPHYFIINREGVIVNYGSKIRPSYPGTGECIDKWIK